MRTRIEKLTAIAMAIIVLISVGRQAPSQSINSNCKNVKGDVSVHLRARLGRGRYHECGFLNGSLAATFDAGSVVFTADPTTESFTEAQSITTLHGTIVTRDV
jgi:hypothetical protein